MGVSDMAFQMLKFCAHFWFLRSIAQADPAFGPGVLGANCVFPAYGRQVLKSPHSPFIQTKMGGLQQLFLSTHCWDTRPVPHSSKELAPWFEAFGKHHLCCAIRNKQVPPQASVGDESCRFVLRKLPSLLIYKTLWQSQSQCQRP